MLINYHASVAFEQADNSSRSGGTGGGHATADSSEIASNLGASFALSDVAAFHPCIAGPL
jgi:hypothetical protein